MLSLTRRTFLEAAAATALLHKAAVTADEARPTKAGKIKVGCLSWCFHNFGAGADPTEAIEIIGSLGFDGVELILTARQDIAGFWTDTRILKLRDQLKRNRLEVSQFVMFQPVVEGLSSVKAEERERNLNFFEAGCKIGKKLEAPLVNIVAPWPREWSRPGGGYLPRHYELIKPKADEKFRIDISPDFDWDLVWDGFVQSMKACLERAKRHGLRLTIEHHTHTLVPDAVSFLRLWDAIRDPALGYNLDTGWTLSQREYPPVAIHKTKKQLMNVHVRDIDGQMSNFVHVGTGVMDFKAMIDTLQRVGYSGYVSIEQDKFPGNMQETCKRYLALMRKYIG